MKRVLIVATAIFAVIGVFYVVMLSFLWWGPKGDSICSVYPVMVVPSTNGTYVAEMENEYCPNKDEQVLTIVWVSDRKSVNLGGKKFTIFRAPSTQKVAAGGAYEPLHLRIAWLSDNEVQISYPRGAELNSSPHTSYGVKVTYQEIPARAP